VLETLQKPLKIKQKLFLIFQTFLSLTAMVRTLTMAEVLSISHRRRRSYDSYYAQQTIKAPTGVLKQFLREHIVYPLHYFDKLDDLALLFRMDFGTFFCTDLR
jgi:hypothetical protein